MSKNQEYYTQFDNVFFEKTRLSMMTLLYKEKYVSFNRFKKLLGSSDGAIYTHLKKLIEGNYIEAKKEIIAEQAQTTYFLTKEGKMMFRKYMEFLENIVRNQ